MAHKYTFQLRKFITEEEAKDKFGLINGLHPRDGYLVFQSDIDADEMVELMEHLWNLARSREIKERGVASTTGALKERKGL